MSILGRSPAALSQAATDFSGSGLIGGAGLAYAFGISVIWWNWAAAPVYIVVGVTIAVLLRKMRVATTPGFLGNRYGAPTQRLAATLQVAGLIMFTGVQIKASVVTLSAFFGMDQVFAATVICGSEKISCVGARPSGRFQSDNREQSRSQYGVPVKYSTRKSMNARTR